MARSIPPQPGNAMEQRYTNATGRVLGRCIGLIYQWALWIVTATLLLTGGVLYYVAENLGVDTDTENILSSELPFRQSDQRYSQLFPQYEDNLVLVIDGDIPERVWDGTRRLAARLEQNNKLFKRVYAPQANGFFERHGLLYLDLPELEEVADSLAQAQPFLGRLAHDLSLGSLLEILNEAIKAKQAGATAFDLQPVLGPINRTLESVLAGQPRPLSWQRLMQGGSTAPERQRQILIVQPQMDFSQLLPAKPAIQAIRVLVQELQLDSAHGLRVRITGDVALSHEELESALKGGGIAGILAMVMTSILLLIGLRSLSLVLATLLTLITGLILTAGFATVAVGHLNLISTAFAVLYIGLGAEYAIQFCVRYQRLIGTGLNRLNALRTAASGLGMALILCALSTAIGFYAFIPTDFSGVSELGLIAGTGMFINLGLTLAFIPALLRFLPVSPVASPETSKGAFDFLFDWPLRYRRGILWGGLLLGFMALALLPQLRFDYNPLNLRNPESESVSTLRELIQTATLPPWSAILLAPDANKARQLADQLRQLDTVGTVVTAREFIPAKQEEKLAIIDELVLLLGPLVAPLEGEAGTAPRQQRVTLREFLQTLESYSTNPALQPSPAAYQLAENFQQLLTRLQQSDRATQGRLLLTLQHSLLATLPDNLMRLRHSLQAGPITLDTLPPELRRRWVTPTGIYRVEAFPRKDLDINKVADLRHFVKEVHSVDPEATGSLILSFKSGETIVTAFQEAFTYALLAITIMLLVLLRSLKDTLLVLVPLFLAGVLLGATMVILNVSFNFANVIALPLLLGVGVDSGIYMVQRVRRAPIKTGNPLRTSTTRALVLSTLVTVLSFGNMLFTAHPGMASMGLLLAVGVALTLLCTLLILPPLLLATQDHHSGTNQGAATTATP